MVYLNNRLELESDITDYIKQHAWVMDIQATPIVLLNKSLSIVYANKALHQLLSTGDSLPTLDELNDLFRGISSAVTSSISESTSKHLNKVIRDGSINQLIPYKVHILPIIYNGKSNGALVQFEADTPKLVEYFLEEQSNLSEKISKVSTQLNDTFNLVTALFDNSPVGMMILDDQKMIMQINTNGANILDVKASDAVGMSRSRFYTANCDCVANKTIPEEVNAVSWAGENKILMRCSVTSEGDDIFSVETFVDITDIELARIAAEESSNIKSEFLANMSHELRTPLHAIMGFSQCGADQDKNLDADTASDFFKKIYQGGEILLALVNNLLDVSKLDQGKIIFDNKPTQVDALVKDVVTELEASIASKGIKVNVEVLNDIESMDLDENRIKQVVRNILTNAVKFSPEKSEVELRLNQTNEYIQLQVVDNGPGIPESELENIFNKFIQSSRTNTGAGGTGLGLSICREILSQHNGVIWAKNNPNGGAIFTVNLYTEQNVNKLISL